MHTHPLHLALATILAATCSLAQKDDPPWFTEEAVASGLEWNHVSGARPERYWFPEIMGGGVALFDYDGDGDLDVYLVQSGRLDLQEGEEQPTNRLFRNEGDGTFTDQTEESGLGDDGYGMGVACGDYDQDGDVDVYVTNVGPNVLYENRGGAVFKDVTKKMKVGDGGWGTSAAFLNIDGDADLDLFLVNNLNWSPNIETPCTGLRNKADYCNPENYNARSTDVLLVKGRLGFQDSSRQYGLHMVSGNGLGVACTDYDLDGDLDVYVANDATPNVLWRNDGRKLSDSGGFVDVALRSGCAVNFSGTPEAGMGVQWVDVNQDGLPDLFMTHLGRETNTFYLNRKTSSGRHLFRDQTGVTGLGQASLRFTGFGMGFQDFDLDGSLDLYVANGAVQAWGPDEAFDAADLYAEPNQLYRGVGGIKFEFLGEGTATPVIGTSRGAAFGDLDNDGDVDVVVVDRDAGVKLLRNVAPRGGSWIGFSVLNGRGADDLGAAVRIETREGPEGGLRTQWRHVHPAYSYLSSNDSRVVFGIPEGHELVSVAVRWSGTTVIKVMENLSAEGVAQPYSVERYHVLRRGR